MKMDHQVDVMVNVNTGNNKSDKGKKDEGFTTIRVSNETAQELKLMKILFDCNGMDSIMEEVIKRVHGTLEVGESSTLHILRGLKL